MKFINRKLLFRSAIVLFLVGGTSYHVYAVEDLEKEIQQTHAELEEQQNNHSKEIKAKTDELDKLVSEQEKLKNDLENKDGELKEKQKAIDEKQNEIEQKKEEIEGLQGELQAKLEKESNLASVQTGKSDEKEEENKSQILSKENESKTEQSEEKSSNNEQNTNIGTFNITYYSAYDGTQIGITAGGTNMADGNIHTSDGYRVVAVDPNVIPLGTILEITTSHGETFKAKADDSGGLIKGNKIDIAVSSPEEAFKLGRGTATVKIVK